MEETSLKGTIPYKVMFVLLCCLPLVVDCKPEGPPEAACQSMRPGTEQGAFGMIGHTNLPQNQIHRDGRSPYYVQIINANVTYQPNMDVTVAVVANQTTGRRRFKGVMLQAYSVSCASEDRSYIQVEGSPLGEFFKIGSNKESLLSPMTCHGVAGNTLAHTTPQWKINETAIWRVPSWLGGHVVFRATIVQDVRVYWTEQHSRIMRDPHGGDVPRCDACRGYHSNVMLLTLGGVVSWVARRRS